MLHKLIVIWFLERLAKGEYYVYTVLLQIVNEKTQM